MKNKGLLASSMDCQKRNNGTAMVLRERAEQGGSKDGYTWRCTCCHTMKTIQAGKLPLNKWIFLLHLWSMDVGVCTAALQAEVSEVTAVDVYQGHLLNLAHK